MKSPFYSLTIFFSLLFSVALSGQTYTPDKLSVSAKAISDGTDITIRWAPMDFATWEWGLENGYRLERTRVDTGISVLEMQTSHVVLDSVIVPWPVNDWQTLVNNSEMAGVGYAAIYGDSFEVQPLANADFMTIYNTNQQRETRFGFGLFAADHGIDIAMAMGFAYVDTTAVYGQKYLYKVIPVDAPVSTTVVEAHCIVPTAPAYQPPIVTGVSTFAGDMEAVITWSEAPEHYTSYLIEKSADNGATWQQVNDKPFVSTSREDGGSGMMSFRDSLSANNTPFVYRVKGCSPFGLIGPASDTAHVSGKPGPLGVMPLVIDVEELNQGELTISWEFPMANEADIQEFEIHRSRKYDGLYKKLNTSTISVSTRSYLDSSPMPSNYYRVIAIDNNGYELSSVPILAQPQDSIPPSAPGAVSGSSSESGVVTLTWTKSPEPDVKGYRVYISNQETGNFTQVTAAWVSDTVFHYGLNLNTMSEEVFFAIKAIDYRENMSELSPVCSVERPDIVPPAAPSIMDVRAEPGKVYFEWELSSSKDVVEYEFQRKPNGNIGWVTLLAFDTLQPEESFVDSTASYKYYWDYRLLARDDAGLISSSKVVKAKPVDDGQRGVIVDFAASMPDAKTSVLEWNYTFMDDPDLVGFQIFRSFDSNPMQSYKFVTVEQAHADAAIIGGNNKFGFFDFDLDFSVPVQTTYVVAVDAVSNITITGGNVVQNGNNVTVAPQNPNVPLNPNPQNGVTVNYWIMAKHFDGGFSPLSSEINIQVD